MASLQNGNEWHTPVFPGEIRDRIAEAIVAKKRRLQRACDICRRRKVRCDGGTMPGNRCTNCKNGNLQCSYVESHTKRSPTKPHAETLGSRLDKMERLISNALAEADTKNNPTSKSDNDLRRSSLSPGAAAFTFLSPETAPEVDENDLSSSDEEAGAVQLSYDMQKLSLDPSLQRFFGKSSSAVLLMTAMEVKNKYAEQQAPKVVGVKRPEYWTAQPWVRTKIMAAKADYVFPDDDLIWSLIDYYFKYVNIFLPLLHRSTFEQQVADGFHRRDGGFGGTVSLVCALGARFSDDPRVLLPGSDSRQSAGWAWYDQVQLMRYSGLAPPSIYEIQSYSLAGSYLLGCSSPQACWNIVGIGLRLIQDVGAHRKKVYKGRLSVSDELWKRAFWCLVSNDRCMSLATGRAPAMNDEDFDLDFPVEVDDEYWISSDPKESFNQPPGKPSTVSFFNAFLNLHKIAVFALRTIYSINRSKVLLGYVGPQWQQNIVTQLDSALNRWVENIPDHLRWDPSREDFPFFDQSAVLYAHYYHTQILVHRPFIPKPHKPFFLAFPSLTICANAARSCSHLVDVHRKRHTSRPLLSMSPLPAFTAGVVLLMNIWGATKSGIRIDLEREMDDVHKCMKLLLACETRIPYAGRFWDTLHDLAEAGNLPLPKSSPPVSRKRTRECDVQITPSTYSGSKSDGPRSIVGNRRVSSASNMNISSPTPSPLIFGTTGLLPVHTTDLGNLPLHHEVKHPINFNFSEIRNNERLDPSLALQMLESYANPNAGAIQNDQYTPPAQTASSVYHAFEGVASSGDAGSSVPLGTSSRPEQPATLSQDVSFPFTLQPPDSAVNTGSSDNMFETSAPQHDPKLEQIYSNRDTLQMWSNAPSGFEWDEWCEFIANFQ